jgi:hypothetical protein
MKVLVWKSHGDIKVYAAETAEQLEGIVSTMIACLDGWALESEIKLATEHIAKHKGDRKEILRAFNTIRNAVTDSDHETFEDVFLTTVLEECH